MALSSGSEGQINSRNISSALYKGYNHEHHTAKWNLITSCFFTIFICSWIAIHPNVPTVTKPPKRLHHLYTSWKLLYERLVLILLFFIFPEFVVTWALVQRQVAKSLSINHGALVNPFIILVIYLETITLWVIPVHYARRFFIYCISSSFNQQV
jgi:hypothetical protein